MGTDGSVDTGVERFRRALAGGRVSPPVTGITFVEPALLPAADVADPAERLAAACCRERLDFAFIGSNEPWCVRAVSLLTESGVASVWVVDGVLWPALESCGVARGLRGAARGAGELEPSLGQELGRALEGARAATAAGATALAVADDMAGASGPLVDTAYLSDHVFPRLAVITAVARAAGLPAILHCDGDVRALVAQAAGAGFDAIHGDAGGAAGLESCFAAARAAGLAFIGGVPTAELSGAAGSDCARWRTRALARGDGLLLADDGGVTTADEARALLATLRAARLGGR